MSQRRHREEETHSFALALSTPLRSQPRVKWTDGKGSHDVIIDGKVLVGSSPNSGLVLADGTVSRLHAEFDARGDGLWVRDLGSRNGTYIDRMQVVEARVPEKGKIRLGALELRVDYSEAKKAVDVWQEAKFGRLVGASVAMREVFATLARIAKMDGAVLIRGETGTGKELVARAIHDASLRATGPFVVVDCAALPENLLDAELFGHTRGAFTGATKQRAGAIESAQGGTVFLDEIGELPITMQPKLLRVLESHTVRRLGESTHRHVDVRFISATHRDLLRMVSAGEFREDLYFRLSVLPITLPPLRERKEDIEPLAQEFLKRLGAEGAISPELMRELAERPWRGNVRELRNFIERALALGPAQALALTHESYQASHEAVAEAPTPPERESQPIADDSAIFDKTYKDFREEWIDTGEKEYLRRLLTKHQRNVASVARAAEMDRTYVYRLIRKHEL